MLTGVKRWAVLWGLMCGAVAPCAAHVTLEQKSAEAGSYYKAVFKVGHGCDGASIRELIVHIPEGVLAAKPMPKAGWQLDLEKTALAQPYSSHGKPVTETTSRVRWSGGELPDAFYDEFVVVARLPERSGPLYWRVTQICSTGRIDWADIPVAGQKRPDFPAAVLELLPKAPVVDTHKH